MDTLCKLTLVCPPAGIERIFELMLSFDPPIAGFSTWAAEGHGFGFETASVSERVRGRVKRQMISAVINRATAARLLDAIERHAAMPHLTYWIEPIESFGRVARTSDNEVSADAAAVERRNEA